MGPEKAFKTNALIVLYTHAHSYVRTYTNTHTRGTISSFIKTENTRSFKQCFRYLSKQFYSPNEYKTSIWFLQDHQLISTSLSSYACFQVRHLQIVVDNNFYFDNSIQSLSQYLDFILTDIASTQKGGDRPQHEEFSTEMNGWCQG